MPPSTNPQPTLKLKLGHFLLHFLNFSGCFFRWANQATPFRSTSADVVVGRSLQSVLHVVYPTLGRNGCQFVKDVSHSGSTYLGTSTQQPKHEHGSVEQGLPTTLFTDVHTCPQKKNHGTWKYPPKRKRRNIGSKPPIFGLPLGFFRGVCMGKIVFSLNFNVAF